ncbi:hypothetical protein C370_06905 [Cryptococcus neoformans A1-35-8]|nr:hypothetical protein C370_06905 [Cryptococcus neoformans var. grubii A1-35-8]
MMQRPSPNFLLIQGHPPLCGPKIGGMAGLGSVKRDSTDASASGWRQGRSEEIRDHRKELHNEGKCGHRTCHTAFEGVREMVGVRECVEKNVVGVIV